MKKYKLYLFDFDGTLLDTMPALSYVFKYAYEKVGIKFDEKETMEFARIPLIVGYRRLNGPEERYLEFYDYIDKSLDHPEALHLNSPFAESMEFFKYLKEHQIHAGIVTSNNKTHVIDVLNVMGIPIDTFELYIGNKECERFKPDPDPINKAMVAVGDKFTKQDVVYVGDGLNDALCAEAAGIDAVIVDRENAFANNNEFTIIKNLFELFD